MADLHLKVTTPSKEIFSGEIKSVTVPGTKGSFQVLKNHAPLISTFEIGKIDIVLPDDKTEVFATGGGTIEVLNNNVQILADSLEKVEDIDIERAEAAKERAKTRIKEKEETTDIERAEAALRRAENRLYLVEKYVRGLR